jgi:1-deoxy-D-xylulose-5-phosphate reductoisomerase
MRGEANSAEVPIGITNPIGDNDPVTTPREIVLLGSTGSIGTQAIDIVRRNPDRLRVVGLGAGGANVELLAAQALELGVDVVGVARASVVQDLQLAFYAEAQKRGYATGSFRIPKILAGPAAMTELATWPCHTVLNGVVGSLGLAPTLAALRAGHQLALANKESLVAGGALVRAVARPGQIVPVDSEHSALAQCLWAGGGPAGRGQASSRPAGGGPAGGGPAGGGPEVRRLVLTASGGAFRGRRREELTDVTPEQALAHPTWDMGPVVTINSATLVNKGLEVIEAHELFGIGYDAIEVMVHPQSVIHSMVEFHDGSTIAQCSPPDMRLPIALALGWPDRVPGAAPAVDWTLAHTWELRPLDEAAFPAVRLAKAAGRAGRCRPAIYNAANEECVAAFVAGRLPFLGIVDTIARVLDEAPAFAEPGTVDEVLAAESWARARTRELIAATAGGFGKECG